MVKTNMPVPNNKIDSCNYIGIDTLQEQTRLKALKHGFQFNILVAGRSGLGKSTLVETLFKSKIHPRLTSDEGRLPSTTEVRTTSALLEEAGVKLALSITDTPGFGDQVNNENCWEPIISYIEEQYVKYLSEEQKIDRPRHITDTRIHCCLYFISPGGHELTSLDVEVLKKLHTIVNLIPVIAKADSLTPEELTSFKERIRMTLEDHEIKIFPHQVPDADLNMEAYDMIDNIIPFGVVGSTTWHDKNGRKVLARKTKWGLIEVENKAHCDFYVLRDIVIRSQMQELVDLTHFSHYEKFRKSHLLKSRAEQKENADDS